MSNDLVAYSRAGDVFHYRWAARRCLSLVHPNSTLQSIVIEGSEEIDKDGEYGIDVSEYYTIGCKKTIKYYQLKHTTQQKGNPFVISDLKQTVEHFAKRFLQHVKEEEEPFFSFHIVTNRPVDNSFKNNIISLAQGKNVNKRFLATIKKYTDMDSEKLTEFCSRIEFQDGEGDYNAQRNDLHWEMTQLFAGAIDSAQVENIVALVQDRVVNKSQQSIYREDILKRFQIFSERELFPAPAIWEKSEQIIERKQHSKLIENITKSVDPVIVHASGGVGKSVFCKNLIDTLPSGSLAIAYDCFGAGNYRNRSSPRHRHREGLVQIINELSVKGLCEPLLVQENTLESSIMSVFLSRIEEAVKAIKQTNESALLYILIDAADNAEMAARENSDACFANELLRETMPQGSKMVLLCRTERINLLKPSSKVIQLELKAFSKAETLLNLQRFYPSAIQKDGEEFHRLTNGNPRVQANALSQNASCVLHLLNSLGPSGTTVEDQIELQLNNAVSKIKDLLSESYQKQVQAICIGLASLPPHVPIKILALAANVSFDEIKSFVSDMGRSLWLFDESVQFRDEPTETWFRKTFSARKENLESYIALLEPLANDFSYVAAVLPQLYLQSGKYERLIELSLSDDHLPQNSPIDARNVKIYRLQFAFRAALRLNNYYDAVKIAIRAGEEMAGNERQLNLFKANVDLLIVLQDKQKVQDIAFKRLLRSEWTGSENVYTASLLSGINEYKGEARSYLRAAINWLQIYYNDIKEEDNHVRQNKVSLNDILEIAYSTFNIYGEEECIVFLKRFRSKEYAFRIFKDLISRLIDHGNFDAISNFLKISIKEPYYLVAIVSELSKVGKFPEKEYLESVLTLLSDLGKRIKKPIEFQNNSSSTSSIVTFIEACIHHKFEVQIIQRVLKYFIPERASTMVHRDYQSAERTIFLKVLAIRHFLEDSIIPEIESIIPEKLIDKNSSKHEQENELREFRQVIYGLLPWYILRIKIISSTEMDFVEEVSKSEEESSNAKSGRYKSHDTLENEIADIQSKILLVAHNLSCTDLQSFHERYIKNNTRLWVPDELTLVRAAFRNPHLFFLKANLERNFYTRIKSINDESPEQAAERFIGLARAIFNYEIEDAGVYFEEALNIISKFGDEVALRWESIRSLAKQASLSEKVSDELAYRFIRCAEVVGNYGGNELIDRGKAIAICTRMSPAMGIAATSRWRDRNVGFFEEHLKALLQEMLKSDLITPSTTWAMARFFSKHKFESLHSLIFTKEKDIEKKETIFSDAIHLLQIEGTDFEYYETMKKIAVTNKIHCPALDKILRANKKNKIVDELVNVPTSVRLANHFDNAFDWGDLFKGVDLLIAEQFEICLQRYRTKRKGTFIHTDDFWNQAFKTLDGKNYFQFIDLLLISTINRYEVSSFFKLLPENWKAKVSFKKRWPSIIRKIGEKYAQDLTNKYSFNILIEELELNDHDVVELKQGIFEGLSSGHEFSNAAMFFGFVSVASSVIEPSKANGLVDYALQRCELHIENDFGDGEWTDDLATSDSISNQIAGLVYSALGSPHSKERWNAVHVVRMLGKYSSADIIDSLVKWMKIDKISSFGHHKFPFYKLHAQMYLLIAFGKVSQERPDLLISFFDTFVSTAKETEHILIQKFASEIVFNLSDVYKEYLDPKTSIHLKYIGKNQFPMIDLEYSEKVESYWHLNGLIDTKHGFHFGLDMGDYWFKFLGDAFGISTKQIEDIAADVIINEWDLGHINGYKNDPRHILWDRSYGERDTWYSKTDYPRTDNATFYLSYHAMMVVASKLLKNMPRVAVGDWNDGFDYWLEKHLLTCDNGKWLSDFRDPVPLIRPEWSSEENDENWRFNIPKDYFYNTLISEPEDEEYWINIEGGWEDKKSDKIENVRIRSALVSKSSSTALMNALQTCIDPYDYKLPYYKESDAEINLNQFQLMGWIKDVYASKRFDKYDPYADNIDYPPYLLGDEIIEKLNLTSNDVFKEWYSTISEKPSMICKIWSSHRYRIDEDPDQAGKNLKASLSFLKYMCKTLDCNFIIEVEIKRDKSYKYRHHDDEYEYSKPKHQLFLLSSDGKLRTTEKNYNFG
ncbi:dsDNA nuclease domain-containing protein [Chryseobacterium sp. UNC8MFCol]|uniref:dsDNA nuclease domain-containing protein n=1 Tax=Chryseobacterium sp. UNC8MFCol TaxID=1340435 RepID=UPI0004860077|nr:dsDNA nuclease domain-containing protein [Chryseobacterium sp. UNC8MFCol]